MILRVIKLYNSNTSIYSEKSIYSVTLPSHNFLLMLFSYDFLLYNLLIEHNPNSDASLRIKAHLLSNSIDKRQFYK